MKNFNSSNQNRYGGLNQLANRLVLFFANYKSEGFFSHTLQRAVRASLETLIWVILLPVVIVGHLLGYRRVTIITDRIGHLSSEIDCFLKLKELGELPNYKFFIAAPLERIANRHLYSYWEKHLCWIVNRFFCFILLAMSRYWFLRYDVSDYVLKLNSSQKIYEVNSRWRSRPPILHLSNGDLTFSESELVNLGVPKDRWFACIHVREAGFSRYDDATHAYRNAEPGALLGAIEEIRKKGGICVRMGDKSNTPMPNIDGLIDYAFSDFRSARMDVILCAKAKFFLGNTSGISFLSSIFGVPSLLVNMIPTSAVAYLCCDLSIPKLIYDRKKDRLLTFSEVFESGIANFRYTKLFERLDLAPIDNSSEEIAKATVEMIDKIDRGSATACRSDLQKHFSSYFKEGDYGNSACSSTADSFLRTYEYLLT